jgi:DNA transformation protein
MDAHTFYDYAGKFGHYQKRAMFGGTGLFKDDAMYALVVDKNVFIRGGDSLDTELLDLGCKKYRQIKKQTTATVNYYDITKLINSSYAMLDAVIEKSIQLSIKHRQYKKSTERSRLRDLPNMQLTLERMVKKSGVPDVETFMALGPVEVFKKVQAEYGCDVDIRLLWKFSGAVDGVHWKLLKENDKKLLMKACDLSR